MRIPIIVRAVFASLVAGALVAACHDPESRIPTSPSAPSINTIDIGGPASVPPGQSVQLVANAHMSDGSVKTVTSGTTITWRNLDPGLLQISQTGLVTAGQGRGEALITVDVKVGTTTRHASRSQLVLPTGTFRLVGTVKEDDSPSPAVIGARVEVTGGDPFTVTDTGGQYRLYGVPASADIQVSGAGYTTFVRHVTLSTNSTENFLLQLNGPRLGLNGNYTLAIDVTDCSGSQALSAGLRHRTYDASVTQSGSTIDVLLTEPRFRLNSLARGNRFSGHALGGGATFTLDWYDSYYYPYYGPGSYPTLAESLPDGTFLVAAGNALVSGTPTGLSGTLVGSVTQWDSLFPGNRSRLLGTCYGQQQFALTAR
jgi:hypothetical protein